MTTSELRIGNLICFIQRNNNPDIPDMPIESLFYRVEGLNLWEVHCREGLFNLPSNPSDKRILGITDVSGIRLTEEWLRRFGFKKDEEFHSRGRLHYHLNSKSFYSGNDHVSGGNSDATIKYVHQLQNIYFALTGEELKLQNDFQSK